MMKLKFVKGRLNNMKRIVWLFIVFITFVSISFAHPGRTDSNGGHYDRSTGEYHYHNGGYEEYYETPGTDNEIDNEQTGGLIVKGDDEYLINLRNENQELEEQLRELKYKQEEVKFELDQRGLKDIYELGEKFDEKSSTIESLNFICILLIIIMIFVIYKGLRYKNRVEKEIKEFKQFYNDYHNSQKTN